MSAFIADHTGSLKEQSSFLRPVHIGAALVDSKHIGCEPDIAAHDSISKHLVYADLRLYHHIRNSYEDRTEYVAILQYRRMYFLGQPKFWQLQLLALQKKIAVQNTESTLVPMKLREPFMKHLAGQSDRTLADTLNGADFIANKMSFGEYNLTEQHLKTIVELYPRQQEYIDSWHDLRTILERKTGTDTVRQCFDSNNGYFHNCFVSTWGNFLRYYDFLFEILEDLSAYRNVYRLFGYLAERIFSVFLAHTNANVQSRSIMFFD